MVNISVTICIVILIAMESFIKEPSFASLSIGIINAAIISIIFNIVYNVVFKKVNDSLVVYKSVNGEYITQDLSLGVSIKFIFRNNFKKNAETPKLDLIKVFVKGFNIKKDKKLQKFFNNNTGKKFIITTHEKVLKQLQKLDSKGYIRLEIIEEAVPKTQVFTRLLFVGPVTILCNLFNKNFWLYIKRPMDVGKYLITILWFLIR